MRMTAGEWNMLCPKTTVPWLLCCAIGFSACQSRTAVVETAFTPDPALALIAPLLLPTAKPTRPDIGATQKDAALIGRALEAALDRCNLDKEAMRHALGIS